MSWAVAVLTVAAGCGVSDGLDRLQETIDETFEESQSTPDSGVTATSEVAEPQWAQYANETGLFTVELPDEPEYEAIEQEGATINTWSAESEADTYGVGEYFLEPGQAYDFDAGVIGAVDGVVNSIEDQLGQPAGFEIVDQYPEVRDGHVGVRFVATVAVEGSPFATVNGAAYDTGGVLVLLTMVDRDSDNAAGAQRFIESLNFAP